MAPAAPTSPDSSDSVHSGRAEDTPTSPMPGRPKAGTGAAAAHTAASSIGPYRILQTIGEGGMGVVYLAEQTRPVRRRVALKVIKLGLDTREVVTRFEAEKQALARMDHPGIAKVFDAGVTEDGRPYFAMEHVAGVSIADYCDRHELSTRERLDLFILVCDAVQHAHQKGIIHRDLKVTNVLVQVMDGEPLPKVIDFGVAKATSQPLTERTLFTERGQLIGTPEYMSPEQAEMTGLNIDTRTDIYALGVMLYVLLVGTLPFDRKTLFAGGFEGIRRHLREVEPPRPSTRLEALGSDSGMVARMRRSSAAALRGELKGDLDWITMKAMEKDRTRRYASASELAADIKRHLHDEPVQARPPSAAYRIRKFVRRHRVFVFSAAAVVVALVAGIVGTTWQAVRASRAEDEALGQAAIAAAVNEFLTDMLAESNPEQSPGGRDATVRELLDGAAARVAESFSAQPEIRAAIQSTIGTTYRALGCYDDAESHMRSALATRERILGKEHLDVATSQDDLGEVLWHQGKYEDARPHMQRALEIRKRLLGEEHADVASSYNNVAALSFMVGEFDAADSLYRRAIDLRRRLLGDHHPDVAESMSNLATLLHNRGQFEAAEPLYKQSLAIQRMVLGADHPDLAIHIDNLAVFLKQTGQYEEAEPLCREALAIRERTLGPDHPAVAASLNSAGRLLQAKGDLVAAEEMLRRALAVREKSLGPDHPDVAVSHTNLGLLLRDRGDLASAREHLEQALPVLRQAHGVDHPRVAHVLMGIGSVHMRRGDWRNAAEVLSEALAIYRKKLSQQNSRTGTVLSMLGSCFLELGRHEEAEAHLLESLRIVEADALAPTSHKQDVLRDLVRCFEARGNAQRAAEFRALLTDAGEDGGGAAD